MTHPGTNDADSNLTLTAQAVPGRGTIVTLEGALDIMAASVLREQLLRLLRPGASQCIVDLSAVGYADASGLAVLVSCQRRAVLLGGGLRLAAPSPQVLKVLAITGLDRHLEIYPTVRAAMADEAPVYRGGDPATAAARQSPAQALAEPATDSGELRAAVATLLTHASAWRDADPRRRFSPALHALAQAYAGTSSSGLIQAARSLLSVLGKEPLTYSPSVATTANRLRVLLSP